MLKNIRHYFVSGLLILAPLFLTILFLGYLFRLADGLIVNPVFRLLPAGVDLQSRIILTKIIIAACVVVFVTALGVAAEKFIFKRMIEVGESVLSTIPVFNRIYRSFKDIALAIFGNKSGIFKRVVFFEYPRKGIYAMGFVTEDQPWSLCAATGKELVSVFIPSPPNPASGYFVFVPKEDLLESAVTVEEGVKLCVSLGAALPQRKL